MSTVAPVRSDSAVTGMCVEVDTAAPMGRGGGPLRADPPPTPDDDAAPLGVPLPPTSGLWKGCVGRPSACGDDEAADGDTVDDPLPETRGRNRTRVESR